VVVTYGRELPVARSNEFWVAVMAAKDIAAADKGGTSDPYVQIKVPGKKAKKLVLKTDALKKVCKHFLIF